jgi:hypothetical protein
MVRKNRMVDGQGNEIVLHKSPQVFVSAEQTADGNPQSVAHTLDGKPAAVVAVITEIPLLLAGAVDVAYGAHTDSACVVTATASAKYKILAFA